MAKDVKSELEETLAVLSGKGKGAKSKKPRGTERKKLWEDVKALRKEYAVLICYHLPPLTWIDIADERVE